MNEQRLKWQFGLDVFTLEQANMMLDAVGDMPDIIEVGTPLIFCEGLPAIRLVRKRLPEVEILVDCKMIDAASQMSPPMYEAGADIITVEGGSHDYVISEHARYAHELGKPCEADLMNVKDLETRAVELMDLGVDIIGMHATSQALRPNEIHHNDIRRILTVVPPEKLCIAHSVNLDTLELFLEYKPAITVVQLPVMQGFFQGDSKLMRENALRINEIFEKHRKML